MPEQKPDDKILRSRTTAFNGLLRKKDWSRTEFARKMLSYGQPDSYVPESKEVARVAERTRYQLGQDKLTLALCSEYAPVFGEQPSKLYIEYTAAEKAEAGGTEVVVPPAGGATKKAAATENGAKKASTKDAPKEPTPAKPKPDDTPKVAPAKAPTLTVKVEIVELGVTKTVVLTYSPEQLGFTGEGGQLSGAMDLTLKGVTTPDKVLAVLLK